jgi:hypothetical protein
MFAGPQALERDEVVGGRRREVEDQLDRVIRQDVGDGAVSREAELSGLGAGQVRVEVGAGGDLEGGVLARVPKVLAGDPAAADDGGVHG